MYLILRLDKQIYIVGDNIQYMYIETDINEGDTL